RPAPHPVRRRTVEEMLLPCSPCRFRFRMRQAETPLLTIEQRFRGRGARMDGGGRHDLRTPLSSRLEAYAVPSRFIIRTAILYVRSSLQAGSTLVKLIHTRTIFGAQRNEHCGESCLAAGTVHAR